MATDDIICAGNRAMTPAAGAAFTRKREREIEMVSGEIPIHTEAKREPIPSFCFLERAFRPTHAGSPVVERTILSGCYEAHLRRLTPPHPHLQRASNAPVQSQNLLANATLGNVRIRSERLDIS